MNQSGAQRIAAAHASRTEQRKPIPSAIQMLADLGAQAADIIDLLQSQPAPSKAPIYVPRPVMIKLNADGQHLPDKDDVDQYHVATLLPQYGLMIDATKPELAKSHADAKQKASELIICGSKADGLMEDYEFGLIIRRDLHSPAADKRYFPRLRTDYIYWTNTDYKPNSDFAWDVHLGSGYVHYGYRDYDGLVLGCRRVSPSQ